MRKLILPSFCILHTFLSTPVLGSSPPILDHYPLCRHADFGDITVQDRIYDKRNSKTSSTNPNYIIDSEEIALRTSELLKSLQKHARDKGADALIIVSKIIKEASKHGRSGIILRYKAKLISGCSDLSPDMSKPAPINKKGKKVIARFSSSRDMSVKLSISNAKKPVQIKMENETVWFEDGVYGVKLGDTFATVRKKLGTPSVEISILNGELVWGYGRNHWFYFQLGKLVKIDTYSEFLDVESLNMIPLRDFFDDHKWRLNNKVKFQADAEEAALLLDIAPSKVRKEEAVFLNGNETLKLRFTKNTNPLSGENDYVLGGFSLQNTSYRRNKQANIKTEKELFELVGDEIKALEDKPSLDLKKFIKNLGEPVAKIKLGLSESIAIFNRQLYIKYRKDVLTEIHFSEPLLKVEGITKQSLYPWNFRGLFRGQVISDSMKHLPLGGFDANNSISYEADNYELELRYIKRDGVKKLQEIGIYLF